MRRIWSIVLALALFLAPAGNGAQAAGAEPAHATVSRSVLDGALCGVQAVFPNGRPARGLALPGVEPERMAAAAPMDFSALYGPGEDGLYPLEGLVTEEGADGVWLWNGLLAVRRCRYEAPAATVIAVYDLFRREQVGRLELEDIVFCGFLEDGTLWTTRADNSRREAALYRGADLSPHWRYSEEPISGDGLLYFSGSGRYLLAGTAEGGVQLVAVADGSRRQLTLEEGQLTPTGTCGDTIYLWRYGRQTELLALDAQTGTVTGTWPDGGSSIGPLRMDTGGELLSVQALGGTGTLLAAVEEYGFYPMSYCAGWLLANTGTVLAMNCADGSWYRAAMPRNSYVNGGAVSDAGYAVVALWEETGARQNLYIWDFLGGEKSGTAEFFPDGLEGVLDEMETGLERRYGVELYCGGSGNDFDATDYVARFSDQPLLIYRTLQIVDEVLGRLPEGMIGELRSRWPGRVRIFLAGTLYRTEYSGITNAAAITYTSESGRTIVLDIGQGEEIRSHLAHELSHVLDGYMEELLNGEGLLLETIWDTGNPDWFSYALTYHDAYGGTYSDPRYTLERGDEANAWFVRGYSKTFPTEDRATVLETMFWDGEGLRGEHLRGKGMLLGALLRHCFVSVSAAGRACWEETFPDGYETAYEFLFETDGTPLAPAG